MYTQISNSFYEVKKSKFYSYLFKIDNFDDYKQIITDISKKHKKACHVCFAFRLNGEIKINNDQEVGEPARVILNYLNSKKLNSNLIIVARVFGGTKLGVGGVSKAFRESLRELS